MSHSAVAPLPAARREVGQSRPPSAAERHLIDELMADTEEIRELHFIQPVDVRIQDRKAMRDYVSRAIHDDDLTRTRRRYVALGLLDPAVDVRDLVESLMEEELVGYYDPKERALAVRDDVARALGRKAADSELEWRATVVHELVHALQDQHLGLGKAMDAERTTDADDAFGALVEGDATLAMLGYVAAKVGVALPVLAKDPRRLSESLNTAPDRLTGAMRAAPAIVREPLLFRYREGTMFAAALLVHGGWGAVNAAHGRLPADTLSVLAPGDRRHARGLPALALPDLGPLERAGYKVVDQDVLGAFELGVAVDPEGSSGARLSRSWRGDRYAVLERAGADASLWCIRFSSRASARHGEHALRALPDAAGVARTIQREGTAVLVARGLDPSATRLALEGFRVWAHRAP